MIITYALLVPGISLGLLVRKRRVILERRNSPLADALRFLHSPYKPSCFWYELLETARKTFLVGFIVWIEQGSLLQLVVAIAVATCALVMLLRIAPHRRPGNGLMAVSTSLAMVLTLLSCVVLRVSRIDCDTEM